MATCRRCHEETYPCPVCDGTGSYNHLLTGSSTCTECDGTGRLCPNDGKHWT